jgi:hypothetical protein
MQVDEQTLALARRLGWVIEQHEDRTVVRPLTRAERKQRRR